MNTKRNGGLDLGYIPMIVVTDYLSQGATPMYYCGQQLIVHEYDKQTSAIMERQVWKQINTFQNRFTAYCEFELTGMNQKEISLAIWNILKTGPVLPYATIVVRIMARTSVQLFHNINSSVQLFQGYLLKSNMKIGETNGSRILPASTDVDNEEELFSLMEIEKVLDV